MMPLSQGEKQISAFQISFSYEDRLVAQKVAADLVSRFMTENTRERTTQSVLTTAFLKDQLENAKKELDTIEQKAHKLPHERERATAGAGSAERANNEYAGAARFEPERPDRPCRQEKMLLEADLRSMKTQRASLTPSPETVRRNRRMRGWCR